MDDPCITIRENKEISSSNLNNKNMLEEVKKSSILFSFFKAIVRFFRFVGPAFIVSVAYIDPGNFATNINGGSLFDYQYYFGSY